MASSRLIPPPKTPTRVPWRFAVGAATGLVIGGVNDSVLAGLIVGGASLAFLYWDARSLVVEGQADALRRLEGREGVTIEADEIGTYVRVPLHRDVPYIYVIEHGQGELTGDEAFDADVRLEGDDAQWISLLFADVRATLVELIDNIDYDRDAHAFIISAHDRYAHADLQGHVDQAEALAIRLHDLTRQPALRRLRARMQETKGAARLPVFKAMWRADRGTSARLAPELSDIEIRYFVATASSPPDRNVIKAVAHDANLLNDLRVEALLRWLGLSIDLHGDGLGAAFAALRDAPETAAHSKVLTEALAVWTACAPSSAKALRLLGEYGNPNHLGVIGAQRNGNLADAAQDALTTLSARFEGFGTGNLALSADNAGHLALTQDASEPESD